MTRRQRDQRLWRAVRPLEALVCALAALAVLLGFLLGAETLGIVASVIAFVLWLPQAVKAWESRSDPHALAGVSLSTQVLVLANAVLWAGYGVETGALWVAAPGLVNAPLSLLVMGLIVRSRLVARGSARESACSYCDAGEWHRIFITAPPGWASVMPCSEATRPHGVVVTSDQQIQDMRDSRP